MELLIPTAPPTNNNPWDRSVPINTIRNVTRAYLTDEVEEPFAYNELCNLLYSASPEDKFILIINTHGGHLSSAIMLSDAISNSLATVTAHLVGSIYSAGTMIALACDELIIADYSDFMIHYYSGGTFGKGAELKQRQNFVDTNMPKMYHQIYDKFLTEDEIKTVIDGTDIWLSAEEVRERWYNRNNY